MRIATFNACKRAMSNLQQYISVVVIMSTPSKYRMYYTPYRQSQGNGFTVIRNFHAAHTKIMDPFTKLKLPMSWMVPILQVKEF